MSITNVKNLLGLLAVCRLFVGLQAVPTLPTNTTTISHSFYNARRPYRSSFFQPPNIFSTNFKHYSSPASTQQPGRLVVAASREMSPHNKDASNFNQMRDLTRVEDARANKAEIMIDGESKRIIWEIQNGVLKLTDFRSFTALRSDKSYVLLQHSIEETVGDIRANTFYWIGKDSSPVDAADAASQALLLDAKIHPVMQVRREIDGQESFDFQVSFKQTNEAEFDSIGELPTTRLNENRKRMFVIEGEDEPTFREVELSSIHVLGNNNKCLVFISNKVYASCRRGASKRHEKSAREMAKIMMRKKQLEVEEVKIHKIDNLFSDLSKEEREDLLQFFAEFGKIPTDLARQQIADNPEKFNAEEIRRITDQTDMRDGKPEFFRIKVTRIYEERYGTIEEEELMGSRIPIVLMNTKDCHLVDTRSNLGLVVWMGEDSEVHLRRECARKAEIYAQKNGYDYATPIIFVDQRGIPPGVLSDVQDLIHIIHTPETDNKPSLSTVVTVQNDDSKFDDSATIPLDEPMMIIWRVKEGRLERISDGIALESDKCYVLFQNSTDETSKTELPTARIFYWIGQDSSKTDAADAASHAVVLDNRVHEKPQIRREAEGQETYDFKAFFKQLSLTKNVIVKRKDKVEVTSVTRSTKEVKANRNKMFSIEGKPDRLDFNEVELSFMNVLGSDQNCLVFISANKAHVACGSWATERHIKGAKELAKIMMERRKMKTREVAKVHKIDELFSPELLDKGEEEDLRQFVEEFDRIPIEKAKQLIADDPEKFEPEEVRRILDQTVPQFDGREWFNVKVFRIYQIHLTGTVDEEYMRTFQLIPMGTLDTKDCYLIDSQSTVGLFLWMGKESGPELRKASAKKVELYLRNQGYSNATFITYLGEDDVPPGTKSVQSMVYVMNPENKVRGLTGHEVVEVSPPVTDEMGCRNCKASGMCVNCPERRARILSLSSKAKKSKVVRNSSVPVDEDSVIDVESSSTTLTSSAAEADPDSASEDSNSAKVDVSNSITNVTKTEEPNLPKVENNTARANKLPTRRADNEATKSDKIRETLEPLKEVIKQRSKSLENALTYSQIIKFLENSNKKNTSVKEALKPLKLSKTSPQTIIKQLDIIRSNVKDRRAKIRITKLKDKIN